MKWIHDTAPDICSPHLHLWSTAHAHADRSTCRPGRRRMGPHKVHTYTLASRHTESNRRRLINTAKGSKCLHRVELLSLPTSTSIIPRGPARFPTHSQFTINSLVSLSTQAAVCAYASASLFGPAQWQLAWPATSWQRCRHLHHRHRAIW